MIYYTSTRGDAACKGSSEAIIKGIAPDNGLYVPEIIPALPFDAGAAKDKPYSYFAHEIIRSFFTDYTDEEIKACTQAAYDGKFEKCEIAPVVRAGGMYFLELYHGQTAAFKDMALSILPYLLTTAMKKTKEESKICILTATSGDTGKAALAGFADVPGTEVMVFFPDKGVSEVQKRQMVTQEGKNTHVFAIKGNFDDAQTGVKKIFADNRLSEELLLMGYKLSSANSINIGRLVPQVSYYVYGYAQLVRMGAVNNGESINIVVPTGNFGNILAAYYAKEAGLPVNKLICASNENKVLADFISTGRYDINREFYLTNSPSMDILISSNLERLLFHLSGENSKEIASLMESLAQYKSYTVSETIKKGLSGFYGGFADTRQTIETIGKFYKNYGYLMDTHTAVAAKVYEDYKDKTNDDTPALIASTASAYKFAESAADALGLSAEANGFDYIKSLHKATGVKIPNALYGLEEKAVLHRGVLDIDEMRDAVINSLAKKQ